MVFMGDFSRQFSYHSSSQVTSSCISILTYKLQMEVLDVLCAYREVRSIVTSLKNMRNNSAKEFSPIFSEATLLQGEEFKVNMPRITNRQVH